jgi:hypothetical protein
MKCTNATKFHRKSGVAKWRDLLFLQSTHQTLNGSADLPFVIPTAVEGSAVQRTFRGNVF